MSRAAATLLAVPLALGIAAPVRAAPERQVVLFVITDVTYEAAVREPGVAPFLRAGGTGLLTNAGRTGADAYAAIAAAGAAPDAMGSTLRAAGRSVTFLADPDGPMRALIAPSERERDCCDADLVIMDADTLDLEGAIDALGSGPERLVMLIEPDAPREARAAGSTTSPLIVARITASPPTCPPSCGLGLSSDTTRRHGVISHVDVAPTILSFLRVPIPREMPGSPIRIEGERPDALHARYLDYRRSHPFADVAVPAGVVVALVAGLFALRTGRGRGPARAVGLTALALPVALLPVSALPSLRPAVVVPASIALAAALAWLAHRLGRTQPARSVAFLGAAGVAAVLADGLLGWPGLLMPLIGGSSLDGVRFYGLGNGFGGLLVAGAVLAASLLPPTGGVALLLGAGYLGGAPWFGANLGVGMTLFAAAGLWFAFRVRRPLGLLLGGAIAAAALAALLLSHQGTADPTHVTRALQGGGALQTFLHRVELVIEGTNRVPAAWLFVLGLPVGLWVAWRRATPAGRWLAGAAAWRDACVVLALAGIVGYLVNDTYGVAAMAFTFLVGALVVAPLEARWTNS